MIEIFTPGDITTATQCEHKHQCYSVYVTGGVCYVRRAERGIYSWLQL